MTPRPNDVKRRGSALRRGEPARPRSTRRSPRRAIALLLGVTIAVAAALRLAPVILTPERTRGGLGEFGDSRLYVRAGYNLYRGHGFTTEAADSSTPGALVFRPIVTRGPVYPAFIATVFALFAADRDLESGATLPRAFDTIRIVQCVLDATVCVAVFGMVRECSPNAAWPALAGAILYAFCFYDIFYTRALLTESLSTFLLAWGMFFYLRGLRSPGRPPAMAAAGAFLGGLALSRPEYLLFVPLLAGYAWWSLRGSATKPVAVAATLLAASCLVVLPWSVRNFVVFGRPILVTAGGAGYNLFQGTYESGSKWAGWDAFPDEAFRGGATPGRVRLLHDEYQAAMRRGGLDIVGPDAEFRRLAIANLRADPWGCLGLWVDRIPRLWYQRYIPMYESREASGIYFLAYFAFMVAGLVMASADERRRLAPAALLWLYLTLVFLPSHIEPRYGVAAMPAIIAAAAFGIGKTPGAARRWFAGWVGARSVDVQPPNIRA